MVTAGEFNRFLLEWTKRQDPSVRGALNNKKRKAVYGLCRQVGDGLVLDPVEMSEKLLGGNAYLTEKLAQPLARAIAEKYGPTQPAPGADMSLKAVEQRLGRAGGPIGTLNNPNGRIGAAVVESEMPQQPTTAPSQPAPEQAAKTSQPAPDAASKASEAGAGKNDDHSEDDVAAAAMNRAQRRQAAPRRRGSESSDGTSSAPVASQGSSPAAASPQEAPKPAPPESAAQKQAPKPAPPKAPKPESQWQFPLYDYSRDDLDRPDNPIAVSVQHLEDGSTIYQWPDPGANEVYRVIVSDDIQIEEPTDGEVIAITEELSCVDPQPHPNAIHFVAVWAYERIPGSKVLGQCRRIASTVDVHKVEDFTVEFDPASRAVIGRWGDLLLPPHTTATVVTARLPEGASVKRSLHGSFWRTNADIISNNGAGFQDLGLAGGRQYTYLAAVDVTIDGRQFSSTPQRADVEVPRMLDPITDLRVEAKDDPQAVTEQTFTIGWTEPIGATTSIYLTTTPPNQAAIDRKRIPVSQLDMAGLTEEGRITIPAGVVALPDDPNRQGRIIQAVPWNDEGEWDSVYITPVSVEGDEAAIGKPVRKKRVLPPRDVLVARNAGSADRLTFAWPGDSIMVQMYANADGSGLLATVESEVYRKDGGWLIPEGLLSSNGQVVYLGSIQYLEGQEKRSPLCAVQIPALWTYRYEIEWPSGMLSRFNFNTEKRHMAALRIMPISPIMHAGVQVQVALYRHARLPLAWGDGETVGLHVQQPGGTVSAEASSCVYIPAGAEPVTVWFDARACENAVVRLLPVHYSQHDAQATPGMLCLEQVALLDPPLAQLRAGGQ